MKRACSLKILILFCCTGVVTAHDTTHIHPLITTKIADLIESSAESSAYSDIFKDLPVDELDPLNPARQRLYWGTDFDPVGIATTPLPLIEYLGDDRLKPYLDNGNPKAKNVITGVVYEDSPGTKVMHHFYHAGEGKPLTVLGEGLGDTSDIRAMTFFNQAVDAMGGYSEQSKQEAFFLFGQALHHVEDMSSPAHIHNDAHLTLNILGLNFDAGKDDYEGWWLPQQKIATSEVDIDAILASATTIISVTNPL